MFTKPTLHGWTQESPGILKPTPTRADAKVNQLAAENADLKARLAELAEQVAALAETKTNG